MHLVGIKVWFKKVNQRNSPVLALLHRISLRKLERGSCRMQEAFFLSPVLVGNEECHKKLAVQVQFYKGNFLNA